jgi:hypothetical protein
MILRRLCFFLCWGCFLHLAAQQNPKWYEHFPPHKVIGNVYYVTAVQDRAVLG